MEPIDLSCGAQPEIVIAINMKPNILMVNNFHNVETERDGMCRSVYVLSDLMATKTG
jgi:hypothetical protein